MAREAASSGKEEKTGKKPRQAGRSSSPPRPYEPPKLTAYGRLFDVTLAGSPGNTDSGGGGGIEDFPSG